MSIHYAPTHRAARATRYSGSVRTMCNGGLAR
jgi:hypothetical protein